ncbi:MAG: Flp pilus assembly protein CpaB [Alphaproteobacteria bacterium]|nr:Flp pilus assembly protein CpaB [Alphaproteobacteria bacterium]
MNRNMMIVIGGGLAVALLVAMLVSAAIKSAGKKEASANILVATADLVAGKDLKPEDVEWKQWSQKNIIPGSIIQQKDQEAFDAATGRLKRDVAMGEPITRSAFISSGQGNPLATRMENGMRAVAIKTAAEKMVGGFISPGDYVDIILTHQLRVDGVSQNNSVQTFVNKFTSETILENIMVLAIDQTARKEDTNAKIAKTVTLQVTPKEAEKLALATSLGELSLALRPVGDKEAITSLVPPLTTDVETSPTLNRVTELKKRGSADSRTVRIFSQDGVRNANIR